MSKAPEQKVTKTSTCNCGQVEVIVTGVDKGTVFCHCDNCKKASGSAFAHNHRFTKAELQFKKGQDVVREYKDGNTKSGATVNRNFCSNCGSPLFLSTSAIKGFYILHGGCISGRAPQPFNEFFKDDKYAWLSDATEKARL
ncbi:uncharacterized protein LTR77_002216 [Saxophila tyrrhenica]|uniref:CENP-V/GFA domain-containing protein n=1 Tax=Saxophila tyrrhenica TaxID=1690608 RepID=A0AAV9PLF5_9PEZI|nr:hypothetical protein LTR77_002216 [Saxophila tyrrhenica]